MWFKKLEAHQKYTRIAFVLILGGAIANLIDRLALAYVIDFIQICLGTYP